jgi:hypothetical protein
MSMSSMRDKQKEKDRMYYTVIKNGFYGQKAGDKISLNASVSKTKRLIDAGIIVDGVFDAEHVAALIAARAEADAQEQEAAQAAAAAAAAAANQTTEAKPTDEAEAEAEAEAGAQKKATPKKNTAAKKPTKSTK